MPQSITVSGETPPEGIPRRIRHITSIQIRNLTPFPVRDAFASALTQPSEQSQFTTHGRLSDDLDVTIGRKRGRRVSTASTSSHRNANSDNEGSVSESPNRKRLGSIGAKPMSPRSNSHTAVSASSSNVSISPGTRKSLSTAPPVFRPQALRQRTHSSASSIAGPSHSQTLTATSESFPPITLHSLLRDTSQSGLEEVLKSRLVETYVTVTIPHTHSFDSTPTNHPPNSLSSSPSFSRVKHINGVTKGHAQTASVSSPMARPIISPRLGGGHTKSMSISATSASDARRFPSNRPQEGSSPSSSKWLSHSFDHEPNYSSPVHRPSTNPSFQLDARSELAQCHDELSSGSLKVEVWGKISSSNSPHDRYKPNGKGKAVDYSGTEGTREWKILDSWQFDLDNLVPLPEDYSTHRHQLPANALLITLSPPDRTFYLPTRSRLSRTPSPGAGYTSDTEVDVRKGNETVDDVSVGLGIDVPTVFDREQRHPPDRTEDTEENLPTSPSGWSTARKSRRRTAGWQDLLKLVTLQSVIQDTNESLEDVVREIDQAVTHDTLGILTREVSERRAFVRELESEKASVQDETQNLRNQLDLRREELRIRRQTLLEAHAALEEAVNEEQDREAEIFEERARLSELRSELPPLRSSLISTLSFIYPIDLVSPPDLLFSILDVPLPIPVAPTDPAPPLTLPTRKDFTEDTVATALGYAAQVVQWLAAYMGVGLTYPVTCIGSRSLIRDGISAMVGPRMFPLFSKGVDTYRFEYGVFLLNKDIELLMAARDLRALDMRHTLPNLKNLLLTLSDGVTSPKRPSTRTDESNVSLSLDNLSLSDAPTIVETAATPPADHTTEDNAMTPKATFPDFDASSTPTASTASTTVSRKSRTFLDLSPLAGLLRVRYPSSSRTASSSEHTSSTNETNETDASSSLTEDRTTNGTISAGTLEDEDDRRTIRGAAATTESDDHSSDPVDKQTAKPTLTGTASPTIAPSATEASGTAEKVVSGSLQAVLSSVDSVG
ncbi:hypothetical protein QCA50_008361 [Cerrena zonata]|uniref:Autophagy-related protein 14 n=1 Tax=Cerrena zonata TaxID=2478898 RepID=A0AAW0GEH3_9APHY